MKIRENKSLDQEIKNWIKKWESLNPINFMNNLSKEDKVILVSGIGEYLKKYYGHVDMSVFDEVFENGIYGKYDQQIDKISAQMVAKWFEKFISARQEKAWRLNQGVHSINKNKYTDWAELAKRQNTPLAKGCSFIMMCLTGGMNSWFKFHKMEDVPKDGGISDFDNWFGILNFFENYESKFDYAPTIDYLKQYLKSNEET